MYTYYANIGYVAAAQFVHYNMFIDISQQQQQLLLLYIHTYTPLLLRHQY